MGILTAVIPSAATVTPTSALQAAQAAAQRVAANAAGMAPAAAATSSSSLHQEENVTISGSTQRFLIMQKLARSDEVGETGERSSKSGSENRSYINNFLRCVSHHMPHSFSSFNAGRSRAPIAGISRHFAEKYGDGRRCGRGSRGRDQGGVLKVWRGEKGSHPCRQAERRLHAAAGLAGQGLCGVRQQRR